mmetsp:Transcript_35040/g.73677  ORF Transcript_35040/g.73677 Transcript_35040/m.73677 type:complete len:748 (-) Transcript_35040:2-2245(-)
MSPPEVSRLYLSEKGSGSTGRSDLELTARSQSSRGSSLRPASARGDRVAWGDSERAMGSFYFRRSLRDSGRHQRSPSPSVSIDRFEHTPSNSTQSHKGAFSSTSRRRGHVSRSSGSPSELAPDSPSLERVRQRGLLPKLVEGLGACYFADVRMLRYFVKNAPEMLLLPWEMMRRFGVVTRREASKTVYTFISHQWQSASNPFADCLEKITGHVSLINTPYVWLDWWCVPQWSRLPDAAGGPDSRANLIFASTMASFHKLCFAAAAAMCIVKRTEGPKLLFGAGDDLGAALRADAVAAERALRSVSAPPAGLEAVVDHIEACGVDLEYAVRAWCALERCYLPDCDHQDRRLTRLLVHLQQLRALALGAGSQLPSFLPSISADAEAVAQLLATLNRIERIVELCKVSSANRMLYQNAWSYTFLKRCVLRITKVDDYKYLDHLFVTDLNLADNGILFLFAHAGRAKGERLPLAYPQDKPVPLLSLLGAKPPSSRSAPPNSVFTPLKSVVSRLKMMSTLASSPLASVRAAAVSVRSAASARSARRSDEGTARRSQEETDADDAFPKTKTRAAYAANPDATNARADTASAKAEKAHSIRANTNANINTNANTNASANAHAHAHGWSARGSSFRLSSAFSASSRHDSSYVRSLRHPCSSSSEEPSETDPKTAANGDADHLWHVDRGVDRGVVDTADGNESHAHAHAAAPAAAPASAAAAATAVTDRRRAAARRGGAPLLRGHRRRRHVAAHGL